MWCQRKQYTLPPKVSIPPGSSELVHQCSWHQGIMSSLACSSESVKTWKLWKWGGHRGQACYLAQLSIYHDFFLFHERSSLWLCVAGVKKGSKRPLKDPSHPKDHLECSLRPIQATQVTPGPFWTRQKKTRSLSDFKSQFYDLKPIFHWRRPTIHWASETAVSWGFKRGHTGRQTDRQTDRPTDPQKGIATYRLNWPRGQGPIQWKWWCRPGCSCQRMYVRPRQWRCFLVWLLLQLFKTKIWYRYFFPGCSLIWNFVDADRMSLLISHSTKPKLLDSASWYRFLRLPSILD